MAIFELLQTNLLFFVSSVALLCLLIGSFLNVVIHRLPKMMELDWKHHCSDLLGEPPLNQEKFDLVSPRSQCPHCGHLITALENIPVLSFLLQKGRCKGCGTKISARYPAVELLTATCSAYVAWHYGFSWEAAAALILTWTLIPLIFIDLDHQLLPDSITLPILWLGLLASLLPIFTDMRSSIIGAVAGYLSLWSVYQLFKITTGKEGMGYGDFKLLAMLGAWLGWQALPVIILMSSFVGAVVGIGLIVTKRHERANPIPFGPYLAVAGWITMLWGDEITNLYFRISGIPH